MHALQAPGRSAKKAEIDAILDHFNIDAANPIICLTQASIPMPAHVTDTLHHLLGGRSQVLSSILKNPSPFFVRRIMPELLRAHSRMSISMGSI